MIRDLFGNITYQFRRTKLKGEYYLFPLTAEDKPELIYRGYDGTLYIYGVKNPPWIKTKSVPWLLWKEQQTANGNKIEYIDEDYELGEKDKYGLNTYLYPYPTKYP